MTFWSAPHSVLLIMFKRLRVYSLFFSFLTNRCKGICIESRGRFVRKVICQCIGNIMMRCDIAIIDRQMINSVTGFLSLDFANPIPYRFNRCLRIYLGDIISPRYLPTVLDISASHSPSNAIGIQVTLGWFMFEPLEVALFDCMFTSVSKPWFIEMFCYCQCLRNSLFCLSGGICNILQDRSEQRRGVIRINNDRLVQTKEVFYLTTHSTHGADKCCIYAGIDPSLLSSTSISKPFSEKVVHHSPI